MGELSWEQRGADIQWDREVQNGTESHRGAKVHRYREVKSYRGTERYRGREVQRGTKILRGTERYSSAGDREVQVMCATGAVPGEGRGVQVRPVV